MLIKLSKFKWELTVDQEIISCIIKNIQAWLLFKLYWSWYKVQKVYCFWINLSPSIFPLNSSQDVLTPLDLTTAPDIKPLPCVGAGNHIFFNI